MAQRSVTARGSKNEPALNLPNPMADTGQLGGGSVFDYAPWLADNPAYITGDSPVVFQASQSRQPGLDGYMPEPTLPAGNVYRHIPRTPLGDIFTDVGATKVGAPYANGLDNEIPAGLANAPLMYHLGYDGSPNGQSLYPNNDEALVSPLGYANPSVAPGVLIQNRAAGPAGGVGHGGLAIPVVLGGRTIG
jgi:hypothetical protein